MSRYPVNSHKAYHAHVYFDESNKQFARNLCDKVRELFSLRVGTFHERLVGPHSRWSCQITFGARDFDKLIPWLDANRDGLTILVHALTGDDHKDHTDYAYWLGEAVELKLENL